MAKHQEVQLSKEDILAALKTNGSRKGGRRLKDRNYAVKTEWTPEELGNCRLSPQATDCVGVILGLEVETVSEQELFNACSATEAVNSAKQTPWEVFNYYRGKIVEAGFLTELTA